MLKFIVDKSYFSDHTERSFVSPSPTAVGLKTGQVPTYAISTISCSDINVNKTTLQESVLVKRKKTVKGDLMILVVTAAMTMPMVMEMKAD